MQENMQNSVAKCRTCKYADTCGGLSEEVRAACTEYKPGKPASERDASHRWGEMSYYRRGDPRNTPSTQERLRSGE